MEKQVNTDIYLYIIITCITKRFPVESVRCRDGSGINVHKKKVRVALILHTIPV